MTASVAADPGRQAIIDALERHEVDYLVIGAAAAEALGWSGRSEDIDIVPDMSATNLDRLSKALNELDAKLIGDPAYPGGVPVPAGFDARLLATKQVWNLMTQQGQLDITSHPSGTGGYSDLIGRAIKRNIPGTTTAVSVASARDIIASKTAAGRPKDIAMLPALRRELERWLHPEDPSTSRTGCVS